MMEGSPPAAAAVTFEQEPRTATGTDMCTPDVPNRDDPADDTCVVCFERAPGAALACGHQHFCDVCSAKFMSCPLCRQPCATLAKTDAAVDRAASEPSQDVITPGEKGTLKTICICVWMFLFIGGWTEWCYHVPGRDSDGNAGEGAVRAACEDERCMECHDGWIQGGRGCFAFLEDLPPVQVGAALGGSFYFVLIVATQISGIVCEVGLIHRVYSILPGREKFILLTALAIEIVRMLVIDVFVLQQYFSSGAYQIFRAPSHGPCEDAEFDFELAANATPTAAAQEWEWVGADGSTYCSMPQAPTITNTSVILDPRTLRADDSEYYIANSQFDYTSDSSQCSVFTNQEALLDYDETSSTWGIGGHPRFSRVGWVIGGEFALYYFFATFINELADCMFVVPTTTPAGWRCKIFSIALEVAQLGALAPAAVFDHNSCLTYKAPLGVSVGIIRDLIVPWGYCIWSLLLACVPLAACGAVILGIPFVLGKVLGGCAVCCTRLGACEAIYSRGGSDPDPDPEREHGRLKRFTSKMGACTSAAEGVLTKISRGGMNSVMLLSFIPMLLTGCFLGLLVVVGQGSKTGFMQVVTAIVLLADVLFKVGATLLTEGHEYLMHKRVTRLMAERNNAQERKKEHFEAHF